MQSSVKQLGMVFLLLAVAGGATAPAVAIDVRAGLSAQETYVGLPVMLQIQVSNADNVQPPTIPQVDGLEIKSMGTPSRSTQISSINGRTTTKSSLTFAFQVTPQHSGSFQIPPITVHAGNGDHTTQAMSLVATQSETDDLLFVEITGKEEHIYVGQALDVTLQIWLRPYRNREHNLVLSERDMWQLVSDRSTWGLFADRMAQLADNDQRPVGKEVLRKDQSGVERSYYLYEIQATIYPKRPGKIDAADTRIVVNYPTAVGPARDPFAGFFDETRGGRPSMFGDDSGFSPFGSRLAIESVRPIVAETGGPTIEVLPIPTADRPADYRGAVGKYVIATSATPTNVKAGDPIELSIGIAGSGPMDLVQAPPLVDLTELTADFKVPAEPLAGFVKDSRKLFTTTIRPRRAGVTHIPSIPFSYFDPPAGKFVTVHSEPISIHVDPADVLALDAIIGGSGGATRADGPSGTDGKPSAPAAATLFTGDDLLKSDRPNALSPRQLIVLLAVPPLAVFGLVVARGRRNSSTWWRLFGSSRRALERRLDRAQTATEVAVMLRDYLSRQLRCRVASTDAALVGALRACGYRQLAIRYERIVDTCSNGLNSGRLTPQKLSDLKQDVLRVIDDFQIERQQKQRKPLPVRRAGGKAAATLLLVAGVMAALASESAASAPSDLSQTQPAVAHSAHAKQASRDAAILPLAPNQQKLLLDEANDCYNRGVGQAADDAANAKQHFAQAADKYLLLVQSGIVNSRLHTNLANAYLHIGQVDKAVASFRRAIEIDPTNRAARRGLAVAKQSAGTTPPTSTPKSEGTSLSHLGQSATDWAASYLSPLQIQLALLVGWFVLWAAVAARILGYRVPWKSAVTASAAIVGVSALLAFSA